MKRALLSLALAALAGAPRLAHAEPADAGAPAACEEVLPQGATRPKVTEVFPVQGLSGWASVLEVTIEHGKGETVLPEGIESGDKKNVPLQQGIRPSATTLRSLSDAGFSLPAPNGGSPPVLTRTETSDGATTKLQLPFVPLPPLPGRNEMILPGVPIAIRRASGQMMTICTAPHPIRVEDPIANEADPKVRPNPDARPQREEWTLAKQVTIGAGIGIVLAVLVGALLLTYLRRPKAVKLPPARPPWEVALEELASVRESNLLLEGKRDEYFDRVSDAVRKYLGARYGFDGLESTTDEMRDVLRRVRPIITRMTEITAFLEDCDLVKFARVEPAEKDCLLALTRGESIVHMTIPPTAAAPAAGAAPPADPRERAA